MLGKFIRRSVAASAAGVGVMVGVSPDDAKSNLSKWLEEFGLPPLGHILTPEVDTWVLIGCGVILASWLYFEVRARSRNRNASQAPNGGSEGESLPFDLPIREAVDHYVRTFPHSYKDGADRHAFEVLYKAMCTGKLRVVGAKGEDSPSELIPAKRCKRLKPTMVVVPKNWASPHGVRFDLMENVKATELLEEASRFLGYTGLRVRSADLYRLWPKNRADETVAYSAKEPGDGMGVARLIMQAPTLAKVEALYADFQDTPYKGTEEGQVHVAAARRIRQARAEGVRDIPWEFSRASEDAARSFGRDAYRRAIFTLVSQFPEAGDIKGDTG